MSIAKAAFVLMAALAGPVHAEDTPRFTLGIEGGWAISTFTRDYAGQFGPARFFTRYFTQDAGHYGAATITYRRAPAWDARLTYSDLSFPTSIKGSFLGCCILTTWTALDQQRLDLDFGLHRQMGRADLRLGAGVSAARTDASLHQNVVGFGAGLTTGDVYDSQKFSGLGPKLSADLSLPVKGAESNRLIAGISVATLWGDLSQDRTNPDNGATSASANRTLQMASAYLGLKVDLGKGAVRFGLRQDYSKIGGDDPLDTGVFGFLQRGVSATTGLVGYDLIF